MKNLKLIFTILVSVAFCGFGTGCRDKTFADNNDVGVSVITENDPMSGQIILTVSVYRKNRDFSIKDKKELKFRIDDESGIEYVRHSASCTTLKLSGSAKVYRFNLQEFIDGEYSRLEGSNNDGYSDLNDFIGEDGNNVLSVPNVSKP